MNESWHLCLTFQIHFLINSFPFESALQSDWQLRLIAIQTVNSLCAHRHAHTQTGTDHKHTHVHPQAFGLMHIMSVHMQMPGKETTLRTTGLVCVHRPLDSRNRSIRLMVLIRSCPPTQAGKEGRLLLPSIMAVTLSEIVVERSDPKVDTRCETLWGGCLNSCKAQNGK